MAPITLERVTKVYPDGTRAVSEVDLEIPDGSLVVLVGPSGCGKTTLLRMVAGLEDITEGAIRIGDRVVNEVSPKHRDVAMVFQNYALYPHMSVYDNMAFGLKLRRTPRLEIKRRVEASALILGLEDLLNKKPRHLSGGQRQRVAMGRAIVREPRVFLMDEPLSNLDAKLRVQVRAEIGRLQRALATTMIYVTHDQTEAMTLGDLVAVMRLGVIQQVARPQILYLKPANIFVAGFIGSPAMNLVRGGIEINGDSAVISIGKLRVPLGPQVLAARPGIKQYTGQDVIVGIRPEDMEDALLARGASQAAFLRAAVELREEMGAESYLYFTVPGTPVIADEIGEDSPRDLDEAALIEAKRDSSATEARFVARVSPRSRAQEGGSVDIVVDIETIHFFDPDSGRAIYETVGRAPAPSATVQIPGGGR